MRFSLIQVAPSNHVKLTKKKKKKIEKKKTNAQLGVKYAKMNFEVMRLNLVQVASSYHML